MSVYKYRLSATPEQLEAIGMVATEWQRLESIVDAAIWGLADLPENKGRAITTHINIRTRLSILETLFSLTHEASTSLKQLSGFCKHIDKLSGERNRVVHSQWVTGEYGSPMTHTVKARGKLEASKVALPAQQIRDTAAHIAREADSLERFLEEHGVLSSF